MTPPAPRVLDTTVGIAGAYAALLLHQAGGDVVRAGPLEDPALDPELVTYLRQGQRHVDLAGAPPHDCGADIWLCTPTGSERAELASSVADRTDLITVAITSYGLSGPYRDRPASDLTIQADSGALAIRGRADAEPFQMGARTPDWLAGSYAGAAALACWQGRLRGGPGRLVDLSLAEVANIGAANFMDVFHAIGPGSDAEPDTSPRGLETPSIERTTDGWVGFNTNAPHQVTGFLRMIGRHDLADSGAFVMAMDRVAHLDEWQAMVSEWVSVRTTEEVIAAALAHQVPVAPVSDGRSVASLDHVVARENLATTPDGFDVPRRPWRIDDDRGPAPAAPPDGSAALVDDGPPWRVRDRELPTLDSARADHRPLDGLRVLDLTTWWAGPAATGLLASFGADVIHVEGPSRMDGVRMIGLSFPGRDQWWELSPFFHAVNPDKRCLALDLTSSAGRELALRLIGEVDVVVENFTPRVLDKLGLGWDVIHAANPRAVLVRMPAFGLSGPWRDRPGFAQNIEQASGLAHLTGFADDQPRIQRGPSDPNGGLHAVVALLSVLDPGRDQKGCVIESALFDAALPLAAESIIAWSARREVLGRDGNRSPRAAPQGLFACAGEDRWLAVAATTDEQWRALARVIDRTDLTEDPVLATLEDRRAHHDALDDVLAGWAAGRDLDDAVDILATAGVPAAPVRDPRLTGRHPQFRARRYQQVVEHPVTGPVSIPTQPFRLSGVDEWVRHAAPTFGQHTDEILRDLLGLSPDDLARLHDHGTIADHPVGV